MKKYFYSLLTMLTAVFALSSCEDVPMPYDLPINGGGESTTIEPKGSGTAEDPFNVAAAIAKCKEVGTELSTEEYYIQGVVKTIDTSGASQYGNVSIDMIDEGGSDVFKAFQILGIGGKKFTEETANAIKEGDVVVVKGKIYNYSGNTPETESKGAAQLVSINGVGGGDTPSGVSPAGIGTAEDPFNVAAAVAKCKETGETLTSEAYYIKGIVENVNETGITQYGNINVDMVDVEGSSEVFTAFQIVSFNGAAFTTTGTVKKGDVIVVKGKIYNYKGNTPETEGKGASQLVSVNGAGGGDTPAVTPGTPSGSGTSASPYNVAAALEKCKEFVDAASTDSYYVTGTVSKLDSKYANTFYISDDGTTNNQLEFYNGVGIDGATLNTGDVNVGDKVVVYGQLQNYKGNTPELVKGCKIISLTKGSGGSDTGGNTGGGTTPTDPAAGMVMTSADVLAALPNITTNAYGTQAVATESSWLTWTFQNVGWTGCRMCKATDTNLGVQLQGNDSDAAKQGFIYNTTPFTGITKIVLTASTAASAAYEPNFKLFLGTSAHPTSSEGVAEKTVETSGNYKVYTYTYDLERGNFTYLTISNCLAGALYINKIQVITK